MASVPLVQAVMEQFGLSEQEAVGVIMAGSIWISDLPMDKPGMPIAADAVLTMREKSKKYASRSGYKLEKALRVFPVDPRGKTVCDIGASNGGFTDCLLQNGAQRVFAVDVAYGILEWRLREDSRVTVLERTNARHLTREQLGVACDIVTMDVSFISLTKIFPAVDEILKQDGDCICLIKPQFEAPPKALGKNGIIKDPSILPDLFRQISAGAAEHHLYLQNMTISPIHGTNGNVEYLAHFSRRAGVADEQAALLFETVLTLQPDEEKANE